MQALGTALSSGSLSDAQQASAQSQQNSPAGGTAQNIQNSDSPGQALQNIGSALQSGNITDAQQAFAKLQSTKGAGKGHHHHHKGGGSQGATNGSAAGQAGATQPNTYSANGLAAPSSTGGTGSGSSQSINITVQLDITA